MSLQASIDALTAAAQSLTGIVESKAAAIDASVEAQEQAHAQWQSDADSRYMRQLDPVFSGGMRGGAFNATTFHAGTEQMLLGAPSGTYGPNIGTGNRTYIHFAGPGNGSAFAVSVHGYQVDNPAAANWLAVAPGLDTPMPVVHFGVDALGVRLSADLRVSANSVWTPTVRWSLDSLTGAARHGLGGWNTAAAYLYLDADPVTGRSLAAKGTIHSGGGDVAEFKRLLPGVRVDRGQPCGLTAEGYVTDRWSAMRSPRVKSGARALEPALVMGDEWGAADSPCVLDALPLGAEPVAPTSTLEEPADAAAVTAYEAAHAAWKARYDANMAAHDRLAYAGTVWVEREWQLAGAAAPEAGHYVLLAEGPDDTIRWRSVAPASRTIADLAVQVGRVERVAADGTPLIAITIS